MSWLTAPERRELRRKGVRLALLFLIEREDGRSRVWSGFGDFIAPASPLDPDETPLYSGAGDLLDLPDLSQLINGESDRVDFKLSGVGQLEAALGDATAEEIDGSTVRIGVVALGLDWQPATGVIWLWTGEADVVDPEWNGLSDPPTYSLSLSVATQTAPRRRNAIAYYTPAQQRRRSPGDKGCDRVPVFVTGHRLRWPVM